MAGFTLGGRSMLAAALALPLTLVMIGSGGGVIFDPANAFNQLGFWKWVGVVWGLAELGLGVAVWIPYLHRIVGAIIALDAIWHMALNARAEKPGWVFMYGLVFVASAGIALLWKTRDFVHEPRPTQRLAHA